LRLRNRISDITDLLFEAIVSPVERKTPKDFCWPLSKKATAKPTVTGVSFGASRKKGKHCHTGVDFYTQFPGDVVAVSAGQVIGIQRADDIKCVEGWGVGDTQLMEDVRTVKVLVFSALLNGTLAYAGLDFNKLKVHEGQKITKGTPLGVASFCGSLHLELWSGRRHRSTEWILPDSVEPLALWENCEKNHANTAPEGLLNPLELLQSLEGQYCA